MDTWKRVLEKVKKVGALVLAVVMLASSEGVAYASCDGRTCGCENTNCATGTCWVKSETSYCSGHNFVDLPMTNKCPVCGRSCVSWSNSSGRVTCTNIQMCTICKTTFPFPNTHEPPPVYYDLTVVVNNNQYTSAKLNGYADNTNGRDHTCGAVTSLKMRKLDSSVYLNNEYKSSI